MSEAKNTSVSETDTSSCANSSQDFLDLDVSAVSTKGTSDDSPLVCAVADFEVGGDADKTGGVSDLELTPLKGRPPQSISTANDGVREFELSDLELTPLKGRPPQSVSLTEGQIADTLNAVTPVKPKVSARCDKGPDVQNGDVTSTAATTPDDTKDRPPTGQRTTEIPTTTAAGDDTPAAPVPQPPATPRRRGRPPKKKPPPVVTPPAPTPASHNVSELLLPGYLIVGDILKMGAQIKPFLSRPNEKMHGMDTYYSYIAEPMWLLEVKRKLEQDLYASLREFAKDMRLVFENCYRFNGPSNWCTKKALKVEEAFEEKIARLPKPQATACSLYSTHGFRREDFVTPEDIAGSGDYCSALLARIVLDNKKQLAEDQLKKQSALKLGLNVSLIAEDKPQVDSSQSQRELDKKEIFKGMRLKMLETLSDKEIEMAVNQEEKEEQLEEPRRKRPKKTEEPTKVEEPTRVEAMEDEVEDYLDELVDENVVETEDERRRREEREKEDEAWEEETVYCGQNRQHLRSMWELPEIAHFVCCALDVLNMEDIPLYELERMFLIPQASRGLAMLMTSLLSNHALRPRLDKLPPMSYRVWTRKLHTLVSKWYKAYDRQKHDQLTVYEIDPQFWVMMGPWNPLDEYSYHELSYHQRVWLVKGLCDYCFMNQKGVLDAVVELSYSDRDYRPLGCDAEGAKYFYLRPFCERDLRVYREAADPVLWQDKHARHLAGQQRKPRGRPKKRSMASQAPPPKKVKKVAPVRRSTRHRTGLQSYEDAPDYDSSADNECWARDELSGKVTDKRTTELTGDKEETSAEQRSDKEGTSARQSSDKDKRSTEETSNKEVGTKEQAPGKVERSSSEGESAGNDNCDKRLAGPCEADVPLTCGCLDDLTCTKCARKDETCDNIAQDSVKRGGDNPDQSTAQSLPGGTVPTARRPLQNPHWLAPDPANFLLVADSVQSLRSLIDSFTDHQDMALNERLSKKQAVKGRAAEENLVSNLKELLEDFLTFETRLIRSVARTRLSMRRQWERFNTRPANYVDKSEASWLDTSEFESQSSWQTTDALEANDAATKTETDGTLRACRVRARSNMFADDEVGPDFEDQEDVTQSGSESDSDVWELPGSKRKLKPKKTVSSSPPSSPRPRKKKKPKLAPSPAAPVPVGAVVIDLVDDEAPPPAPPARPRQVLQSRHAERLVDRCDFDPDVICLSDEDDLPPPLRPKVIATSSDRPVRLEDIPRLLRTPYPANKPSEKLTKFLQETVKVYNESEVKASGRTGEKVVLLPSMNEKGEMVTVKKLGGQDAAKVLANKKNTQTRHVLPVNGSHTDIDMPSSLRIVKVCSLSQQAAPPPSSLSTLPRVPPTFDQVTPPRDSAHRSTFASVPGRSPQRQLTPSPRKPPQEGQRPIFTPPRQRSQISRVLSSPTGVGLTTTQTQHKSPTGTPRNHSPLASNNSPQYRQPPEGHMVTTPQGQKVYLLSSQARKSPLVTPERRLARTNLVTPPRDSPKARPPAQKLYAPEATPPRQQLYAQNQYSNVMAAPSAISPPTQTTIQSPQRQQQQPTHLLLQRVPPTHQAPPPQQRVLVSYAPQQSYPTQPQMIYPQTVSNPATGILQALANRQSYVQQQTVQSYQMVGGGDQYVTQYQESTAHTVIIRQSTYVSAPVYASAPPAYSPVVTISDDSDEGGEVVARPKLIFVLDDTGPQYARVLPNGDRVILSAGELAKIREENGGVLPI